MNPVAVVGLLLALLVVATGVGLAVRATTGRARRAAGSESVTVSELVPGESGGTLATLLQFSTEFCSPCVATGVQLERLASAVPGVRHIDVDITHRPDVASRFGILQSPTTLLLDGDGAIRARVGGAPRLPELRAHLTELAATSSTGQ